jgi:hypothetical protein
MKIDHHKSYLVLSSIGYWLCCSRFKHRSFDFVVQASHLATTFLTFLIIIIQCVLIGEWARCIMLFNACCTRRIVSTHITCSQGFKVVIIQYVLIGEWASFIMLFNACCTRRIIGTHITCSQGFLPIPGATSWTYLKA